MRVRGAFGTDHVLLNNERVTVTGEDVTLRGTVAVVQQRGDNTALSLGAAGRVTCGDAALQSETPATLSLGATRGRIDLSDIDQPATLRVRLPAKWAVQRDQGVSVTADDADWLTLTVSPGSRPVRLEKKAP